jgi:hypothetical protein
MIQAEAKSHTKAIALSRFFAWLFPCAYSLVNKISNTFERPIKPIAIRIPKV